MVEFYHDEFNQFIGKQKRRFAKSTYLTRQSGLVKFEYYILLNGIDIDDVNQRHIDDFLDWLQGEQELTDITASTYITAVRKFYDNYYMATDDKNPCRDLNTDHMDLKNPEFEKIKLNEDELRALIDAAPTKRSKALVALLAGTGLRIQEACKLKYDTDRDWRKKENELILGKRMVKDVETLKRDGHKRTVYFDRRTRRILKDYINSTRAKYGESDYLFIARNVNNKEDLNKDKPMSVARGRVDFNSAVENCDDIQHLLEYNETANGAKRANITSHICRRSFCQIFVDNGGDLMSLKNIAGWETLETAKNYLEGDNDLDTRDKFGPHF